MRRNFVFCEHKFDLNSVLQTGARLRKERSFFCFGFQAHAPFHGGNRPDGGTPDSERVSYWTNRGCHPALQNLPLFCDRSLWSKIAYEARTTSTLHNYRTFSFGIGMDSHPGLLPLRKLKKVRRGLGRPFTRRL